MSTTIIAVAGLLTTLTAAFAAPFLQGRVAVKTRLHEQRLAAYTDAMVFLQYVDARLEDLTEELDYRTRRRIPEHPDQDFITARVRLLAPDAAVKRWNEFVASWDVFLYNIEQDGPMGSHGEYYVPPGDKDVLRVKAAGLALETELKKTPKGWVSL